MNKMRCPVCKKRAVDISGFNKEMVVGVKCPNCNHSVIIPCVEEMCMGVTEDTIYHSRGKDIKKKIS